MNIAAGPLFYSKYGMEDGIACPLCGFTCTHIDRVEIATRSEDKTPGGIAVNAIDGTIETRLTTDPPVGTAVGEGRRHRIALIGWCESSCHFAIVFTQHKGDTLVEVVRIAS